MCFYIYVYVYLTLPANTRSGVIFGMRLSWLLRAGFCVGSAPLPPGEAGMSDSGGSSGGVITARPVSRGAVCDAGRRVGVCPCRSMGMATPDASCPGGTVRLFLTCRLPHTRCPRSSQRVPSGPRHPPQSCPPPASEPADQREPSVGGSLPGQALEKPACGQKDHPKRKPPRPSRLSASSARSCCLPDAGGTQGL